MSEAAALLARIAQYPRYHYLPISARLAYVVQPFLSAAVRNKADDRCLPIGLAAREVLALVTLDKAAVHLAGDEHREHVSVIGGEMSMAASARVDGFSRMPPRA